MSRSITLSLGLGILLVIATLPAPSPALASQQVGALTANQSRLAALTQSYFAALNHALVSGSFSDLRAAFTTRATLTERSSLTRIDPTPQSSILRGQRAVIRFYRHLSAEVAGSRWIVGLMNQASPTTMVAYAHTSGGPRSHSLYSMQRLIVRNSTIVSVDLTLYYEP